MLFRTVYGPELPLLHSFVRMAGGTTEAQLHQSFVQGQPTTGTEGFNLHEALEFLLDVGAISRDREDAATLVPVLVGDFRLGVLERLQRINHSEAEARHPLDPWYMRILERCFVRDNRLCITDLHRCVNTLPLPTPCSEEKANAWRRVMEFLGCGRRINTGFLACYRSDLVLDLLRRWQQDGPLDEWLRYAETYIPVYTQTGDLTKALAPTLEHLEVVGALRLEPRADYAGRAYLGERKVKWLVVMNE